jgi:hypothetical protein
MVADIFVSYHSADRALTEALTERLGRKGFSVWFDRELTAGGAYRDEIDAHLNSADLVLALWTPGAAASAWVIAEARAAHKRGRLVSINVAAGRAPAEFASTVVARIKGDELDQDAAKAEGALRRAAGAALGYERIYAAGEILPHRLPDVALTFLCLWALWTCGVFAAFYLSGVDNVVRQDGELYFRVEDGLARTPNTVLVTIALFATSFSAPFAALGAGAVDFVGRRLFRLSIAASKRRVALRLFGEGVGSAVPFCLVLWLVATPTRAELLQRGVSGWAELFLLYPLILGVVFAVLLLPKYLLLFSSRTIRRACVP